MKMELYKKDGDISAYYLPAGVMDGITLFFAKGQWMYLQLNLTSSTLFSVNCGINRSQALDWLWECGKKIVESDTANTTENVTITSHDVRDGELITPFSNLRRDASLHLG
ncbi:hypothetical protein [Paenibacillus azoreducens]|uniref:Uncharacterized protein n=1 Tax=Paenibacillus azoreducens TaxID=116718 RepID=A0A919YC37_9BACL|nr:hypothetical protein [Paenibacillus azoreducens]GIO47989.1 hypothetical protein J34TS1_27540 [Paenibacillus azoreducens]